MTAEDGNAGAQNKIVHAHENVKFGLKMDLNEALTSRQWRRKAAEGGVVFSQWRSGVTHEDSKFGLEASVEGALTWYKKVANGGDSGVQCRLADAYERGELGLAADEEAR